MQLMLLNVVELASVSLGLLSHHMQMLYMSRSGVAHMLLYSSVVVLPVIIRCLVIVVLQSQTLTQKATFWLCETAVMWTTGISA